MENTAVVAPYPLTSPESIMMFGAVWLIIALLVAWSTVWKIIALWKSARNGQKVWFIVLFVLNTVGILEMIYVLMVSRQYRKSLQPQTDSITPTSP